MKAERVFYSSSAVLFLALMLIGFRAFYTHGTGAEGRPIDPVMLPIVIVHGTAIAAWFVLFFVQSLLITLRSRRVHMRLGWSAVAIGAAIGITGSWVAIRSVQVTPPIHFFGFEYARFLLVMLTEIAMFVGFLTVGILSRKNPTIHRPMMLLAGLTIVAGATARMPAFSTVFGQTGWVGLFGPVFCIGAVLLLIRVAITRRFDRWLAAGYAVWVTVYIASAYLSSTDGWSRMAATILKL